MIASCREVSSAATLHTKIFSAFIQSSTFLVWEQFVRWPSTTFVLPRLRSVTNEEHSSVAFEQSYRLGAQRRDGGDRAISCRPQRKRVALRRPRRQRPRAVPFPAGVGPGGIRYSHLRLRGVFQTRGRRIPSQVSPGAERLSPKGRHSGFDLRPLPGRFALPP